MPRSKSVLSVKLYQRPNSPSWWYAFSLSGRRYRGSCGTGDRQAAEEAARQRYDEIKANIGRPVAATLQVDLPLLGGLDIHRANAEGAGDRQHQAIECCWRHLVRLMGEVSPAAVTFDTVQTYIAARRKEGARGQSITREIQALKRGLVIARRRRWLAELPELPRVRSDPPKVEQKGKLVSPEVLGRWLHELPPHARAQAELVLSTGLRAEEIRRLRWSWVEDAPPSAGVAALLRVPAAAAKNRRERVVGLTAYALALLQVLRAACDGEDVPLTPADHKGAYRGAARRVGLRGLHLRDLRHTHASLAAQHTGDASAVQAALGHSDLRVTQRYLSSTITRATSSARAVGEALNSVLGHTELTHTAEGVAESDASTGGDDRARTDDPLRANRVRAFMVHINSCNHCYSRLEAVVLRLLEEGGIWHTEHHIGPNVDVP